MICIYVKRVFDIFPEGINIAAPDPCAPVPTSFFFVCCLALPRKVAYRVPGASTADWVDIYNRLYRERIIFLGQEIDDELANQIIGVMLVSSSVRPRDSLVAAAVVN